MQTNTVFLIYETNKRGKISRNCPVEDMKGLYKKNLKTCKCEEVKCHLNHTDVLSTQPSQAGATDGPAGHMDLLGHKRSWALASPTGKDYSY